MDFYKGLTPTASGVTYGNMITAGTYPSISIDFGKDEPDMTPNRELLFLAGIIEKTFLRVQCHEEQMHTIVA